MRALASLFIAVVLTTSCGGGAVNSGGRPAPRPSTSGTEAEPPRLPGSSCKGRGGGSARNIPDFVGVKVGSRGGVDRVEFLFRPRSKVSAPPSHYVRFTDEPLMEGEGDPAEVEGTAFVVVVFGAFGTDVSGPNPTQIYTGPSEFTPGFGTVREVEQLGDFEATVTWAIGLSRRACFRMEAEPDRLVVEFPSA